MNKGFALLATALCSSLLFVCVAVADEVKSATANQTSNDFFTLYGRSTNEISDEVQQEYEHEKWVYETLIKEKKQIDAYNKSVEEAEIYKSIKLQEIQDEIMGIAQENVNLQNQMRDNFFGDWEVLLSLDAQYKSNNDYINYLLKSSTRYSISKKIKEKEVDWEGLNERMQIKEKQVANESDVSILGIVSGVDYPVDSILAEISSEWGPRINPKNKVTVSYHNGVDIACPLGVAVKSIFNGTVANIGFDTELGNYIKINHGNGIASFYTHVDNISVVKGQKVNQYDVIALSGQSGKIYGVNHIHFGLFIDGNSVDPAILLGTKES